MERLGGAGAGWPGAGFGGGVAGAVWSALAASGGPVTVRELAVFAGVRRDSVGRALRSFERAGWACREHGDVRRGIGDTWCIAAQDGDCVDLVSGDEVLGLRSGRFRPRSLAKMKAASRPASGVDWPAASCGSMDRGGNPPRKLAKGELQGLVLNILRDSAPESVGVVALARMAGGRSQGAVADACERLVGLGQAVMVYKNARQYMAIDGD